VQVNGGDRKSEEAKISPTNVGVVPSAKDHAEALGIADRTVERWERDRKEIKSDPDLSAKASTPEGYQEAKAEVRKRRNVSYQPIVLTMLWGPSREYRSW